MTDKPDPSLFSINTRPREYRVCFKVCGSIEVTIMADSLEEAQSKADEMAQDEDFGFELDSVDDVRPKNASKLPPMFRVLRDGKIMQKSFLEVGDIPREPDERGF